ncbi:TRAP transporter small permease [Roseovarius indicus]|uniref:TRAP transporter small permease protein n=2 Tax=Roseovarius indicus TaxID=540747 RepID=A0A0T5P2I1_9RHOB|nr:TRAP transporter small permease [Roseovarius indicus]KRS15135.1 C4-dicarboxylate ABC transporter permease [Roseovarius indicus]OAO09761.1 C4-dicarboxylate ABC transporter permease [Roseovarius indicus]
MQRLFMALARIMAVLGGVVLTLVIFVTCFSVAGRMLNGFLHGSVAQGMFPELADRLIAAGVGPLLGDFELVEAGVAFAIFAFLPLCQITGGHASVDIFTSALPRMANRVIQLIVDWVFAVVLIVIAWQLYQGMLEKVRYNETTFMLQFPVWWAYAASLVAATVAALVGLYVACARVGELATGRVILHGNEGADA